MGTRAPTIGIAFSHLKDRQLLKQYVFNLGYQVDEVVVVDQESWNTRNIDLYLVEHSVAQKFRTKLLDQKKKLTLEFEILPVLIALPAQINPNPWLKAGFDDVIRLPFSKEVLATRLEVWLRLREESRKRFHSLYENTVLGLYRTTPDGKILLANPALVKMLGYDSEAELQQHNLEEEGFKRGYDRETFKQLLESEGVIQGLENIWKRKDGSTIYIRESARVIRDSQGNVLCYEGTVEEITDRVRAEKRLKAREKELTAIFESTTDGILVVDQRGKVVHSNRPFKEMWKIPGKIISRESDKELLDFVLEQLVDPQGFLDKVQKLYRSSDVDYDTIFFKDGRTFERYSRPWMLEDVIAGRVWIFRDITQRKRIEEEQRQSQENLRNLFRYTTDAIIVQNYKREILDCNLAAEQLFGYSREELISDPSIMLGDQEKTDNKLREKYLQQALQGKSQHFEWWGKRKDGSSFPEEIILNRTIYNGEEVVFITTRDITERRTAEKKIQKSLHEKEVLLKEIHHRVKNNLQVISSLLNIQAEGFKDMYVQTLFNESRDRIRSMALVHENLYQSGDYSQVNFREYLKNLVEQLSRVYQKRAPVVSLNLDVAPIRLTMNLAIPCGIIVNELVTNALKHAFPKDKPGNITVTLKQENQNQVRLTVADNGVGTPVRRIPDKGSSIGKDLVAMLVKDQLQGLMHIHQERGTVVEIRFPLEV